MSNYRSQIVSSILDIPRAQWDAIWPYPDEGYEFYRCQESSEIEGFEFSYLTLYHHDTLVLVAPLFVANFGLELAMEGRAQQLVLRIQKFWPGFLKLKTLFCGGYVTEKAVIGLHEAHARAPELWQSFDRALTTYAKSKRARMIVVKDIRPEDTARYAPLTRLGYAGSFGLPMAYLPTDLKDMDAYFATLSGETRKDLRRKMKKTEALGGVEVEEVADIRPFIDRIYPLYCNVEAKNTAHFGHLTQRFFTNFSEHMPEQAVYFLYWIRDQGERQLAGFNFCLKRKDSLMDKFIGMDYHYVQPYNLYFISYLKNVEWCLKHGLKIYMLNQGGESVKKRLGAQMMPMRHLTKMTAAWVNRIHLLFTEKEPKCA